MIRRILCVLAAITMLLVCMRSVNVADCEERDVRYGALDDYTAFRVANAGGLGDPEVFWDSARRAADASKVNLFRKVSGWTADDHPSVVFYAYFASSETSFFESFSLPNAERSTGDLKDASWAFATVQADGNVADGEIIGDVAQNDACKILPMASMLDAYPVAGQYWIEAPSAGDAEVFVSTLQALLADASEPVSIGRDTSAYETIATDYSAGGAVDEVILGAVVLAVLMLIVAVAYCQLAESRRWAILISYGSGSLRAWFCVCGRLILVLAGAGIVLGTLGTLFVPGSSGDLVLHAFASLALAFGLVVVASLATAFLGRPRNMVAALKGRDNAKDLVRPSLFAKAVLCVILVAVVSNMFAMQRFLEEESAKYEGWAQASQYGLFVPLSVGMDGGALETQVMSAVVFDLYPFAVQEGCLYIDATQYSPAALSDGGGEYPSVIVNPNYLRENPIAGTDGEPVVIEESETDWVILAPERYRGQEQELRERWERERGVDEEWKTLWDRDIEWCGRTTEAVPADQGVEILWIADGQSVFAYDPEIGSGNNGRINDAIVEVLTLGNSCGVERWNAITGGMDSALKVPLIDGDTAKTYGRYQEVLEKAGLADNLKQVVTSEGAIYEALRGFREVRDNLSARMAVVLVAALFLSVQSAFLLFSTSARKSIVMRLYGFGFCRREMTSLAVWGISWAAVIGVALVLNSPLGWLGLMQTVDDSLLIESVSCLFLLDALVFMIALLAAEKRGIVNALKGAK